MMSAHKSVWLCVSFAAVFALAGCAAKQKPAIHLARDFQPASIGRITILPAVDGRIDQEIEVNLDEQIRQVGAEMLTEKGYVVVVVPTVDIPEEVTDEDLRKPDPSLFKRLGPSDARWIMILGLIDVSTTLGFGSTGNAEVVGFLYDKQLEALLWRDKGIGQLGQGGLLGMALKAAMDEAAIYEAMKDLFTSLPDRTPPDPAVDASH